MRKKIGLKYGTKKKVDKRMGLGNAQKIEFYWISLYHSERFWAYAMELKQVTDKPEKVLQP